MSSEYSGSASSDLSEETPPQRRKSTSTLSVGDKSAGDKSLNLSSRSRALMTPEEKKKQKDLISDKYFKLMEKYGPKRKFLQEKDQTANNGEEGPPVEPVGFVIKFRLSHAYKALEKQEIEASTPDIKPVRKRKRTKFLLPDERRSEVDTLMGGSMTGLPSSGTGTGTSTARTQATRKVQIRIRTGPEKENAGGGGGGKGGVWQALTKQKASAAVQLKEKQQREDRQQDQKGGKGSKEQSNQGQSSKGQVNQKQSNQFKQTNQKQSNQKQSNQKQSNQKQLPNKGKTDNKRPQSAAVRGGRGNNVTEADKQEDRQRSIERSLRQLRVDTRQQKDRRTKELWDSHFQGIGGMGLPGSIGAATTDYSFRMFSETCYSGSITMDAVTITGSRPSSPSKSLIDGGSRPSSSGLRRGTSQSPKPRTSTPANGRAASPMRPQTARTRTPAANVRSQGERRRAQSAGPPGGKSPNDSSNKVKGGKSITAILRMDGGGARGGGGGGGKGGAGEGGKEGDVKVLAPRKISKYLYHMCNCHQVARKETLSKLIKKRENVAGVIDVFGCPDVRDPRARVLACPFCNIVPKRRISAWLDNLEDE